MQYNDVLKSSIFTYYQPKNFVLIRNKVYLCCKIQK